MAARLARIVPGLARALIPVLALAWLWGVQPGTGHAADPRRVSLFAAASTLEAMNEIARRYAAEGHGRLVVVAAGSSTLAKQIAHGAPADLFLSANRAWLDYLDARGLIAPAGRVALLGNRLALIAPRARPFTLALAPGADLAAALGDGRLAIGDPAHVPAGIYAKAALEHLGLWPAVAARVVFAGDVRAVLALVDRAEAAAGVVYESDLRAARASRLVALFPPSSHEPISYGLAMISGRDLAPVRAAFAYLRGDLARGVFRRHGFAPPPGAAW